MTSEKLPTRAELEGMVRGWIDDCVWRHEVRLATTGIEYFDHPEIERMAEEDARELDCLFRRLSDQFAEREKAAIGQALRGDPAMDRYRPIVESAAREIGVSADPATVAGRLFERTILRGYATLCDELRETAVPIPREPAPPIAKKPVKEGSFVFTAFWDDFERHKLAVQEWKTDTAANARGSLNLFNKINPGLAVARLLSEPIATNFKATMMQLPGNYSRGKRASKTIDHLIALGGSLRPADRMQKGTVNKHVANLKEYWDYLVSQKKLSAELQNPFAGLHIPKAKGKKARDERHNWPQSLERQLFESPLYTGCASIHRRAKKGQEIHRDALFWMPLLARTMGTRENEICDALVGSVKIEETDEGSIPYLEILDGKDSGSTRDVPFADLVLDMGFMEQRVIGRDPDAPLFPELIPQGPGKRRSAAFSDRFAYYRRAIKVYRPRVDFHSFRGCVETDLKNTAGINTAWIDELIGHESIIRRSEGDRYTKKIRLPILKRLVNSISIAADLSLLRYHGVRGVPAPERDQELGLFTALAEREMEKKRR
ncbi:hypothetical protein [Bradyrhizobium sp. CCBAU 25338]|uniref:hypothetical protein n=1 Tax=Bradyrhizobium sp. CCBAU 25338 TaxID=1641877 RepID=UPI0023039AA8|nr:hypothetical protein [Bradyrhizobium sp. CCBAU 25338]